MAAEKCGCCNGAGQMQCRQVEESEWHITDCPGCAGLGVILAVAL